ncbi:MAG: murein transglycosylase domain-containing protein [Candidatus Marinimicrobia bacterium]|nr:murein transglycosylase domain-containing protein [Candidatus Neomarinimicrobiota bacterium]
MNSKWIRLGWIAGICLIASVIGAQDQPDVRKKMDEEQAKIRQIQEQSKRDQQQIVDEFRTYQIQITKQYEDAVRVERDRMETQKAEILKKWKDYRFSDNEEIVDYSKDLNSRGSVNFKDGKIRIETVVDSKDPQAGEKAKQSLQRQITDLVKKNGDDGLPLLKDQLKTPDGIPVTSTTIESFSQSTVSNVVISSENFVNRDGQNRTVYSLTIPMVPNHIEIRAARFKDEVLRQAKRFDLDPRLIFAVIHTESFFNPNAQSLAPAYGLMQLVPSTGARDAYNYLYKQDKFLTSGYLFIPENNIELGCAYLAKIRSVYFGSVSDDDKATYCTIAAYNAGPGNVMRAIAGTNKIADSLPVINSNDSTWLYHKLLKDLPTDQAKKYLKNVSDRIPIYEAWK